MYNGLYINQWREGDYNIWGVEIAQSWIKDQRNGRKWFLIEDIDGDGDDDALIIGISCGRSGYSVNLVAVLNDVGKIRQAAIEPLGDRTVIRDLRVENKVIYIEVISHNDDDPFCCPTNHHLKIFKLAQDHFAYYGVKKLS